MEIVRNGLKSYLTGRSLKAVINTVMSSAFSVRCGVPQGSALGPLLYLVYVDSMRFYLKEACTISFADDTALNLFDNSIEELVSKANRVLEILEVFMNVSFRRVNVGKTFLMTYRRVGSPVDLNGLVTLYEKPVQQVGKLRYLVFIVDCHLSWRNHSEAISANIAPGISILRRF